MTLKPEESATIHIVGGFAKSIEEAIVLRDKATVGGYLASEFDRATSHWQNACSSFMAQTPDHDLNRLMNHWLKKQSTLLARNDRLSTIAPVRNLLQDALGYSLLDPDYAADRMCAYTEWQESGGFLRQWHMLDGGPPDGHCRADFRDAPFWLVACICHMVHQQGDMTLLDRKTAFCDSDERVSVYEHLLRALYHLEKDVGDHGLCHIGEGDWFDPLNGPGRKGRGESTWLTMATRYAAQLMIPICERRTDQDNADRLRGIDSRLGAAINTHCWDQDRYVAGFDDNGEAFGCSRDEEGSVFLNPQSWAIISRTVPEDRVEALLKTLASLDTPFGPLITSPAYTKWDSKVGRISLKQPGSTENGSVYCHGSLFASYAYCLAGMGDKAYDVVRRTLPTNPDNPPEKNLQVPLFVPNFYFALPGSPDYGQSSQSYPTGTCPWVLWLTIEHLLGVRATLDGLVIDPGIPLAWDGFTVERQYRKARYRVVARRAQAVEKMTVAVDGTPHGGGALPYEDDKTYEVEVILPKA
jgi:cellobiose phosphorylase/cellobionic acid phosphorylase